MPVEDPAVDDSEMVAFVLRFSWFITALFPRNPLGPSLQLVAVVELTLGMQSVSRSLGGESFVERRKSINVCLIMC
jgi:hypothetical protein